MAPFLVQGRSATTEDVCGRCSDKNLEDGKASDASETNRHLHAVTDDSCWNPTGLLDPRTTVSSKTYPTHRYTDVLVLLESKTHEKNGVPLGDLNEDPFLPIKKPYRSN